jgi:branched-chain amino acid transport system substrate-binding protein
MGKWMVKKTPYRNIVVIATDFKAGHDSVDAFKAAFEASGGKVIKEVYPKLGTMDYFPFLSAADVKGADATFAWLSGTDAVRFVQQYQESGMKKRLPLFGHNAVADNAYLSSIGDPALGVVTSCHYTWTLDTPLNRAFVKAYVAKYGETPSVYSEHGYTAGKLIVAGIEALKGEVENSSRVAKELKRISSKVQTPSGPLAFDKYNQRIVEILMVKTEKKDGKLANVVIDSLGTVAQEDVWNWWRK